MRPGRAAGAALVMLGLAWVGAGAAQPALPPPLPAHEAAQAFSERIAPVLDMPGFIREEAQLRLSRCDPGPFPDRDDVYHVRALARLHAEEGGAAAMLETIIAAWRQADWAIFRDLEQANGGRNIAATDPATGDVYSLDSGFQADPDGYIVAFFNSLCFTDPTGAVAFGRVDAGL